MEHDPKASPMSKLLRKDFVTKGQWAHRFTMFAQSTHDVRSTNQLHQMLGAVDVYPSLQRPLDKLIWF